MLLRLAVLADIHLQHLALLPLTVPRGLLILGLNWMDACRRLLRRRVRVLLLR
jgi:hypothetical protein